MLISPSQCRMARAALDLSMRRLAEQSRIPLYAISKFEKNGPMSEERCRRLIDTFSESGIVLLAEDEFEGSGVRLAKNFRSELVFDLDGLYVADVIGNALVDAFNGARIGLATAPIIDSVSQRRTRSQRAISLERHSEKAS